MRRAPALAATRPGEPAAARRVRALARFLDTSIRLPGLGYRIGWDAVVGLVPGVGDVAGGIVSCYIVLQAARLGTPASTLLRMLANIGLEMIVGAVPVLGDLFDAAWKANTRNVRLLDRHLADPGAARRAGRAWLLAVAGGVVGVMLALVLLVFQVLRAVLEATAGLIG